MGDLVGTFKHGKQQLFIELGGLWRVEKCVMLL